MKLFIFCACCALSFYSFADNASSDEALEETGEAYLGNEVDESDDDIDIEDDSIELDSENKEEKKPVESNVNKSNNKDNKKESNKNQKPEKAKDTTSNDKNAKTNKPKKTVHNANFAVFITPIKEITVELEQHIKNQTDSRNRSIFRKLHAEYLSLLDYLEDAGKTGIDKPINAACMNIALDDIYFTTAKHNIAGISEENISIIHEILFKTRDNGKILLENIRSKANRPAE